MCFFSGLLRSKMVRTKRICHPRTLPLTSWNVYMQLDTWVSFCCMSITLLSLKVALRKKNVLIYSVQLSHKPPPWGQTKYQMPAGPLIKTTRNTNSRKSSPQNPKVADFPSKQKAFYTPFPFALFFLHHQESQ